MESPEADLSTVACLMRLPHRSSPFRALALPMTMREDLARVRPTFMRRSSATKPMLRPTCVRTVLKIATSFSLPCSHSLTTHSWLTQSHASESLIQSALTSCTGTANACRCMHMFSAWAMRICVTLNEKSFAPRSHQTVLFPFSKAMLSCYSHQEKAVYLVCHLPVKTQLTLSVPIATDPFGASSKV